MNQELKKSVGYLIFLTAIGQLISFIRESIFAYYYGTSYQADAYVMASQIPIALFAVITTSINTVILPIYTSKMENEGQERADKFMNSFIVVFELMCLVLAFVSCTFTRQIVFFFAPAFKGELLELTVRYVRVLFPTIMLSSIINILTVRYNVLKNFSYPQYVGLFQNLAIIGMMISLAGSIGTDAAVIGTIVGLALNAVFLVIPCKKIFGKRLEIKGLWQDIKQVLSKVIPVACGVGVAEINRIVDKAIASGLDTGSITGINYANKLSVVFSTLIVTALSTVCFQKFSALYAKSLFAQRYKELQTYVLVLIYILLPITCGAMILKQEFITVAFARGAFGNDSIDLTSNIFFYYSIGILPIAIREILSKYFYSSGDTKTPMINSAIGVAVNICLNLVLSRYMGAAGLALATTISYAIVCVLLFVSIILREKRDEKIDFIRESAPAIIASLIMSGVVWCCSSFIDIGNALLNLLIGVSSGMAIYLVVCYFVARRQLRIVISILSGKI